MTAMKCLVVVDIQNDFLPGGALAVKGGDQVIPVINRLMDRFELVVATQDWHPHDHGSFAASHPGRKPGDLIVMDGIEQVLWPRHCVQDTQGAALAGSLKQDRIARIFHKGTQLTIDSYSTFFDNAHRRSTGLHDFLKEKGVTECFLAGLATDYCVKYSALDAVVLGYRTWVVLDGCRGIDLVKGDIAKAVTSMETAGVRMIESGAIK